MIGDIVLCFKKMPKSLKRTKKCTQKSVKKSLKVQKKVSKMGDFMVIMLLSALVERVSVSHVRDFSVNKGGWV